MKVERKKPSPTVLMSRMNQNMKYKTLNFKSNSMWKKNRIADKQINKRVSERMNNRFLYTHKTLKGGYNNTSDSHQINHIYSKKTLSPKRVEIEKR